MKFGKYRCLEWSRLVYVHCTYTDGSIHTCWIARESSDWQAGDDPASHGNVHYEHHAFLQPSRQRMFLEYWYRSCCAAAAGRGGGRGETLNARTTTTQAFVFIPFFIFYSRWTDPLSPCHLHPRAGSPFPSWQDASIASCSHLLCFQSSQKVVKALGQRRAG